jgi:nuclear transport factor 2 (NTF2) superfamily protein
MFIDNNGKKLIVPPFTEESAHAKIKAADDAWISRDPDRVALAYAEDSVVAKPHRVLSRARRNHGISPPQVGEGP